MTEDRGVDHAWVPDSQMIWSDCYAVLALAAVNTSRMSVSTGILIADSDRASDCAFDRERCSAGAGPRFSRTRRQHYRERKFIDLTHPIPI